MPIDQTAGLEHVHPTWAGTFALAAFVFLFPGVHCVLLDSDCVPITLFEVADLSKEISLLQKGLTHATASCPRDPVSVGTSESVSKASKLSHNRWRHQVIGQGVLLVTEHNAEVNANKGPFRPCCTSLRMLSFVSYLGIVCFRLNALYQIVPAL